MNNTLKQYAQTLHLSGLLDSLQLRLQEAQANSGDVESRRCSLLFPNRLIAEGRYQHGSPQKTNGRKFVPKPSLMR
jgi:hypothetical protein